MLGVLGLGQANRQLPTKPQDCEEERQRNRQAERRVGSIQDQADCRHDQLGDGNDQDVDHYNPHWFSVAAGARP